MMDIITCSLPFIAVSKTHSMFDFTFHEIFTFTTILIVVTFTS